MDENIGAFFVPRVDGFEIIALGKLGVSGATVSRELSVLTYSLQRGNC